MQLTRYTDYSLRVLIYLATHPGKLCTITEIAGYFGLSRNHLVKIVHHLAQAGFIVTQRGKHGGMTLARDPGEIGIGDVVRQMEPDFEIAECFDRQNNRCVITPTCGLKTILWEAHCQFLAQLDQYTLAEAAGLKRSSETVLPVPSKR